MVQNHWKNRKEHFGFRIKGRDIIRYRDKKQNTVSKIFFALLSQGMLGLMAILTSIVLPRQMGPEQYGYYQEFTFYATYLNMLGFGLNDGLTLNYAGKKRDDIPILNVRRAIWIQVIYSSGISLLVIAGSFLLFHFPKNYIFAMLGINLVPTILFCIFNGIFLAENNSYLYNISNLMQRALFCVLTIILLIWSQYSAQYIILAYTAAAIIILPMLVPKCKFYLFSEKSSWHLGWMEYKKLCISGIKIALSVCLLGLIPCFGRIIIENNETIQSYGIFSFYIGLLSIILAFTNAVGVIAFPIMRNSDPQNLIENYRKIEKWYALGGMLIFLIYPLAIELIKRFMPSYSSGIEYFSYLFSVCYPIGKIQMLIFPYYKTKRNENKLFYINTVSFLLTMCITYIAYLILHSPRGVAAGTTVSCLVYFLIISKFLPIEQRQNRLMQTLDLLTPIIFLILTQYFCGIQFIGIYMVYVVFETTIILLNES